MWLTLAPETAYVQGGMAAFGSIWRGYLPILQSLLDSLDILQVQLYNSGTMNGLDGMTYTQGTADFIIAMTEVTLQGFNTTGGSMGAFPADKMAVGLPACSQAAGGGYTDTAVVYNAIKYLLGSGSKPGSYTLIQSGGYPSLLGMMTWSINWDAVAACNGANAYAENYERIFGTTPSALPAELPASQFTVYPNPAKQCFYLHTSQWPSHLRLYDISGRLLREWTEVKAGQAFPLQGIQAGIYTLQADTAYSLLEIK